MAGAGVEKVGTHNGLVAHLTAVVARKGGLARVAGGGVTDRQLEARTVVVVVVV